MKTITVSLTLETTTVSDIRSDSSSDSVATAGAERQLSDSGATAVQQRRDNGATAEAISGATALQQQERQKRSDSGAIAVKLSSDSKSDRSGATVEQ